MEVAHILEGNVQKNGDAIRIRVKLIDGRTDAQLWSETYERQFKDVFSIQSEIAHAVAAALRIKISGAVEENIERRPTENMEAYDLYLKASATFFFDVPDGWKAFEEQNEMLDQAIVLDPGFAEAYSRLAFNWIFAGGNSGISDAKEVLSKVKPLLERALQLDPNLVSAHYASALIYLFFDLNFRNVENEYQRIRQLSPTNSETIVFLSDYLIAIGQSREALEVSKEALNDDKNSLTNWCTVAQAYYFDNQIKKAFETIEAASTLFEESARVKRNLIQLKAFGSEYGDVIQEYEKDTISILANRPVVLSPVAIAYFKTGQTKKAKELLNRMTDMSKKSPVQSPSFFAASVFAMMGDKENAFKYLEKAIADREVEIYWTKVYPFFEPLHGEPRWEKIIEGLKYPE